MSMNLSMNLSNVADYFAAPPPPRRRPPQPLSTWGEAIMAAATGNADRMRELLAGSDSDGAGIDLRTFRTSYADVDFIYANRDVQIDAHYTLVEIAVERDHFDVVMALTEPPKPAGAPPAPPPPVARSVSTFVSRTVADQARDHLASHLEVVADGAAAGLVLLTLPETGAGRQTFVLPKEVVELPLEQRKTAIGLLLEDAYTMESIDATTRKWNLAVGAALGVPPDSAEMALPVRSHARAAQHPVHTPEPCATATRLRSPSWAPVPCVEFPDRR